MSRIPREFINELLARSDIVELIDSRVPLKKKGNNYSACCPFHNEKTPSFTVSSTKQFYHCFGCGANGNAISFLMDHDRLSFIESIEQLANQLGMSIPREASSGNSPKTSPDLYQLMDKVAGFYQQQLRQHQPAIDYLKQRGLSGQIAKEFAIGYAPAQWDAVLKKFNQVNELVTGGLIIKKPENNNYYDRFRDRIMFPIRDRRGRTIGFGGRVLANEEPKYLNSPETVIFHKGSELYGLFEACQASRNLSRLVVVEGYMDVVALAQHGVRNTVATLGTATTDDHIQRLFRITSEIIFCFDGDRAGQAAAWRALETTLPHMQDGRQVRFLLLPQGEDPDSFVRKNGAEQFNLLMDNASSLADFLFNTLNKQVESSSPEGKARLAKQMVPLLNKLPVGIFQHMLFERLANQVRMDVVTLKKLTDKKTITQKIVADSNPKKTLPRRTPMRLAIALLLQHPTLLQKIPPNPPFSKGGNTALTPFEKGGREHERAGGFNPLDEKLVLPGSELLSELINLIKQTPNLNTAVLMEHWRDQPEYSLLAQLASLEIGVPQEGIENEFLGTFQRLQQLNREMLVEQLLAKGNQLTDQEKITLKELIAHDKQT